MSHVQAIHQPTKFSIAMLGSIAANALLWCALGLGSNMPVQVPKQPELIFDRVVVDRHDKSVKPVYHPIKPVPPPPLKKEEPKQPLVKQSTETAHSHVIAAKTTSPAPSHDSFVVRPGGNAPLGVPIDRQGTGNAKSNPPTPPPATPPQVETTKPVVTTTPTVAPPTETKKEAPPAPPPPPPPPPAPVKPKGESREAKPDHQENVEIPESLKSQSFKSFVRVRVEISADGKFKVVLRTSSGNTDVDKLVLDTLNKWTWKPALKDGDAVDSVQQFRFNFTIE